MPSVYHLNFRLSWWKVGEPKIFSFGLRVALIRSAVDASVAVKVKNLQVANGQISIPYKRLLRQAGKTSNVFLSLNLLGGME